MKKQIFTLVYQGGIANVFEEIYMLDTRSQNGCRSESVRVMQSDFKACENFCRGLKKAGAIVRVAWCNQAGDIAAQLWHFFGFNHAPFVEKMAIDLMDEKQK